MTSRSCLLEPIPEIFQAAWYLDEAVCAHLDGNSDLAAKLICCADIPAIFDWTERLWGKGAPQQWRIAPDKPGDNSSDIVSGGKILSPKRKRELTHSQKEALVSRDGLHCRFCGIPLVRSEVRERMKRAYPKPLRWGAKNREKHAAFQAMDLQFDHVVPFSKQGANDLQNYVVACAPCNCGRMNETLDAVGLFDPRLQPVIRSSWDGLARFR